MMRMDARWRSAKVNPCKGWTKASAATSAVCAMTAQRTSPQEAATANATVGVTARNSLGPRNRKTTTSAATDSAHSTPTVAELMPAWVQRITAKESYMAWVTRTRAGSNVTRHKET